MKRRLHYLLVSCLLLGMVACTQAPEADKAKVSDPKAEKEASAAAMKMKVDLEGSKVTWIGTKLKGQHNGTINLKSGDIAVKDGKIEGGNFVLNMGTLQATDMDEKGNADLSGHLKSADFFEVEKFPESSFAITAVKPYKEPADSTKRSLLEGATHYVTGNLTLKGVTKGVTFPAVVNMSEAKLTAKANFNINRTDWGLSYGADESLGDRFIRPTVNIGLDITAVN